MKGEITISCPSPIKKILSQKSLFLEYNFDHQKKIWNWGWESPPKYPTFLMKHFWKKVKKVNPYYFSILSRVRFLHFFWKTAASASNCYFYIKSNFYPLFEVLELKLPFEAPAAVFWKKSRKRTPLKIEN